MVGRDLAHRFPPREPKIGETLFEVKDWTVYHPLHADRQVIKDVSSTSGAARSSASPG